MSALLSPPLPGFTALLNSFFAAEYFLFVAGLTAFFLVAITLLPEGG
jgi:hypothetical protein